MDRYQFWTGGIVGTSCIYFYTRENMWESGRNNFLPLNADERDWQLIQKDLDQNNNLDDEIKKLNGVSQLKNWCAEKYKETFSSLFHSTDWILLAKMKNACLLPIRKKLENNNKILVDQKKVNINKLTNINENEYQLTYKLKSIKNETNETNKKRLLWNWCKNISEHGYQNENANKYRLIEELCIDQ